MYRQSSIYFNFILHLVLLTGHVYGCIGSDEWVRFIRIVNLKSSRQVNIILCYFLPLNIQNMLLKKVSSVYEVSNFRNSEMILLCGAWMSCPALILSQWPPLGQMMDHQLMLAPVHPVSSSFSVSCQADWRAEDWLVGLWYSISLVPGSLWQKPLGAELRD